MARVLLSYVCDYGEAFYETLTEALLAEGNSVFRLNMFSRGFTVLSWQESFAYENDDVSRAVVDFDPELVIDFNHTLPVSIRSRLSRSCAVCVWDADPVETFWHRDVLREERERFHFLGFHGKSRKHYADLFGMRADELDRFLLLPGATAMRRTNLEKDKSITFLGSNHSPYYAHNHSVFSETGLRLYRELQRNYLLTLDDAKTLLGECDPPVERVYREMRWAYAGQYRIRYLSVLTDLGLRLFGNVRWDRIGYMDLDLALAYDPQPVVTRTENEQLFNSSKVSFNISHPYAVAGFSWRVMDIMATSSCLLMERSSDWLDMFGVLLSPDVREAIVYSDRFDMRLKAQRLLGDEPFRHRCTLECNAAIETRGRWRHRLEALGAFVSVSLVDLRPSSPQYVFIPHQK